MIGVSVVSAAVEHPRAVLAFLVTQSISKLEIIWACYGSTVSPDPSKQLQSMNEYNERTMEGSVCISDKWAIVLSNLATALCGFEQSRQDSSCNILCGGLHW